MKIRTLITLALMLSGCGGGSGGSGGGGFTTLTPGSTGTINVVLERTPESSLQIVTVLAQTGARNARVTGDRSSQYLLRQLTPGDHVVEVSEPTENCRIEGDTQKTVTVVAESTTTVSFTVSCSFEPVSRIVFGGDVENTGSPDIWSVRPDGTELTRLSRGGTTPSISPDGTRVMYLSLGTGNSVSNVDGSETRPFSPADGVQSTWSPDGTELIVVNSRDLGDPDLWRVSFDGSEIQRITDDTERESDPAWSPDGAMIAVIENEELQLIDTSGSFLLSLGGGLEGSHPRWSPDGSKLVFAWHEPGAAVEFQIWAVNVDGSNRVKLTDMATPCGGPSFSPDGTEIIFHCDGVMWRMNADGTDQRVFAEMPQNISSGTDWYAP